MRLKYQELNEYLILTEDGLNAGLLSFKVKADGIHIYNVFVYDKYKKEIEFTKWLKNFDKVFAYDVVLDAVAYWIHIGAIIVNAIGRPRFEDIIIEKEDYEIFN